MQVIEQFTQGKKGDEALNEDAIVITPDFAGVLDGSSRAHGLTLEGMTHGRFAARAVAAEIGNLAPDITAAEAIRHLSATLKTRAEQAARKEGQKLDGPRHWPACALLLYSRARRELWRVADPPFMVDGKVNAYMLEAEKVWVAMRRLLIHEALARGAAVGDMLAQDPSAEALGLMWKQPGVSLINGEGPYGYGVLNGQEVPSPHIEVHPVPDAKGIVMATDGYPALFPTLAETEAHLRETIAEDPLMYLRYPQVKGVAPGQVSFDDRSYLKITV